MHGAGPGSGWEKLFWMLFQKTTNPIAVIDESRRIVEVNDPTLDLFGRSRGELIGTPVVDLIDPSERSESAAAWDEFMRSGNVALTDREREVVTLIALGRETNEIADELHISPETVRTHVRNAMGKLDVHTRAQLVRSSGSTCPTSSRSRRSTPRSRIERRDTGHAPAEVLASAAAVPPAVCCALCARRRCRAVGRSAARGSASAGGRSRGR